jgi:hypothetical protein
VAELSPRRLFRRRPTEAAELPASVEAPTAAPTPEPASLTPPVRPAGPRGERTVTVAVRLTPAEHARWVAAATEGGRGQMGRWVRETVTARLEGRPAAAPVSAEAGEQLAALRSELSKVGSNLNQVARALNVQAKGGPVQVTRGDALQVVEATKVELGRVRDQLNGRMGR